MLIAVPSTGSSLDTPVDYHTGRAFCFIVYDTANEDYSLIENCQCSSLNHWAGLTITNKLEAASVDVVLVRHIGPNAFRQLAYHQISILRCGEWSVATAIRCFREGKLTALKEPNCKGHDHLH